jgi:hypothetical protein
MGVRKKGRRKLKVGDRLFVWYVADDLESGGMVLHVISEDKGFIARYDLLQPESRRYLTILGKEFGRVHTGNCWRRFRCPAFESDDVITPSSVRTLIDWSQLANASAIEVDYHGLPLPLGGCCAKCKCNLRGMVPVDCNLCPKCGHVIAERAPKG